MKKVVAVFIGPQRIRREAMPIITLEGPPVRDPDRKRKTVEAMTDLAARFYGLPPETIVILIKENLPENVAVGGRLVSDRQAP